MGIFDTSESVLPDYIDTDGLKKERDAKVLEFESAQQSLTDDVAVRKGRGESGMQGFIDTATNAMQGAIDWFKYQNALIQRAMKASSTDTSNYSGVFNAKKKEVEELRAKVEQAKELEGIREEQVASLENRDAANFHTSWMGTPMTEGKRTGIWVAAGFFLLLAILSIVAIARTVDSSSVFFRGGFRRFSLRNRV